MIIEIEVLGKKISVELKQGEMSLEDIFKLVCEQEIKESNMDPTKLHVRKDGEEIVIDETDVKLKSLQLLKEVRTSPSEVFKEMVKEAEKSGKKKPEEERTKQKSGNIKKETVIKPGKEKKTTTAEKAMRREDIVAMLAGMGENATKKVHA